MKWLTNNFMSVVIACLLGVMAWQNQYFIAKLDKVVEKQGTEENKLTQHVSTDNLIDAQLVKDVADHEIRITQAEKDIVETNNQLNNHRKYYYK
jgi:hypothetical protein